MSVGLHIMRPTTIVVAGAGSSASIRADGGVDFATATSLSLNGVFTAGYDNYMIVWRGTNSGSAQGNNLRFRVSGADATGANYALQALFANGSSVTAARSTTQTSLVAGAFANGLQNGDVTYIYGPNLAQPTAVRHVNARSDTSAALSDHAGTHALSTAYDGFTVFPAAGNITGMVTVYGYAQ